jgi:hypothetical protein
MTGRCAIAAAISVLALSASALADIAQPGTREVLWQDVPQVRWNACAADEGIPAGFRQGAEDRIAAALRPAARLPVPVSFEPMSAPEAEGSRIAELPPGPSSLALLLSGLGTLGVWSCGRLVRGYYPGSSPEWLHTGDPEWISLANLLDPDSGPPVIAACLVQPSGQLGLGRVEFSRRETPGSWASQFRCPLEPARAPPNRTSSTHVSA